MSFTCTLHQLIAGLRSWQCPMMPCTAWPATQLPSWVTPWSSLVALMTQVPGEWFCSPPRWQCWWWVFFACKNYRWRFNKPFPARFFFFFFFKVEISSCALIPPFRLGISPQWLSELRWLWTSCPWQVACETPFLDRFPHCLGSKGSPLWHLWSGLTVLPLYLPR